MLECGWSFAALHRRALLACIQSSTAGYHRTYFSTVGRGTVTSFSQGCHAKRFGQET